MSPQRLLSRPAPGARAGSGPATFLSVPDAALALGSTPKMVLAMVHRGAVHALPAPDRPFGIEVMRSDVERLTAAKVAARPA